ncbi:MAG: tetratricopeptide repeat protein, partial [Vampirovibrionia bacterium]
MKKNIFEKVRSKLNNIYIESYLNALKKEPENPDAYKNLGAAYYKEKDYEKALDSYKKAIELSPEDIYAYFGIGVVYEKLGEVELAYNSFKRAFDINPKSTLAQNMMRCLADKMQNNHDWQIKKYKVALSNNPDDNKVYTCLARVYTAKKMHELAIENHKKSISIDPNNPSAYFALAYTYFDYNKLKLAKE